MRRRLWILLAVAALAGLPGRDRASAQEGIAAGLSGEIAYVGLTDGFWQVWVYDAAVGRSRQVTISRSDKRLPAWGPEDTLVARTNNDELCRIALEPAVETPLFPQYWPIAEAVWTPDGRRAAFVRVRTDMADAASVWIADQEGSRPLRVTPVSGMEVNPSWSPDGRRLAYAAGHGLRSYDLYLVSLDDGVLTRLTENEHQEFFPAWSPDGRWIAFSTDRTGDFEIWRMAADGTQARQLTESPALDSRPTWSPDSRHIAFATNRRGRLEIWVMDVDGAHERPLLTAETDVTDPMWR